MTVSLAAVLAAILTVSAACAEPVFPGVGTVGLEPPPGMVATGNDAFVEGGASIIAKGMGGDAYARADADRPKMAADLAGPDAKIDAFAAGGAHGFIVRGRKTVGKVECRVWVVFLAGPRQTAMVGATIPVGDMRITDAAIEAALRTIVFRDTPGLDTQMAGLGFVVGDLAGFRAVAAAAETQTLELADTVGGASPRVVVHADPYVSPGGDKLARRFAEQFLWARHRTKPAGDTKVYAASGGHYAELRAEKTYAPAVTDIAFFVRFDASGAFEIACTAPHPMPDALVGRCRTLALSVRPRG